MTTDERIAALAKRGGWTLVHEQPAQLVPMGDGLSQHLDGSFRFERMYSGSTMSEVGVTLEQALAGCEWQQNRLEQLGDNPNDEATDSNAEILDRVTSG